MPFQVGGRAVRTGERAPGELERLRRVGDVTRDGMALGAGDGAAQAATREVAPGGAPTPGAVVAEFPRGVQGRCRGDGGGRAGRRRRGSRCRRHPRRRTRRARSRAGRRRGRWSRRASPSRRGIRCRQRAPPETAGWFAGGRPWQAPHAACVPSTLFQTGRGHRARGSVAVVRAGEGRGVERGQRSIRPGEGSPGELQGLERVGEAGRGRVALGARDRARMLPPVRWRWWAPTPGAEVAVFPLASTGGAGAIADGVRAGSPWHVAQPGAEEVDDVDHAVHVPSVLELDAPVRVHGVRMAHGTSGEGTDRRVRQARRQAVAGAAVRLGAVDAVPDRRASCCPRSPWRRGSSSRR